MKLSGDEIVYVLLSERLLAAGEYHTIGFSDIPGMSGRAEAYLEAPLFKHPPLYPLLVGFARRLLPGKPIAPFVPNILLSAVSLLALALLARALGMSWGQTTAVCALLAISPTHWTASSRIWLEMTWTTFALLAVASTVRALDDDRWWLLAGICWGLAWLTKYTALVVWLGCLAGVAWARPSALLTSRALIGHVIAVTACAPWLAWRFSVEGTDVILFWRSAVQDWRVFARALCWLWALPVIGLGLLLARRRWRQLDPKGIPFAPGPSVAIASLAVLALVPVSLGGSHSDLVTQPWAGWAENRLAESSRAFHAARPVLFEPILACVLPALLVVRGGGWAVVQGTWIVLFLFLSVWGNFQSRYTLPLIPLGLLLSIAVVWPPVLSQRHRGALRTLLWWGAAAAIVLSALRSIWLIEAMVLEQDYFYF